MEYISEVWLSDKEMKDFEKMHLAYMKNTLCVKTSTATPAIYAELGRFPISHRSKVKAIKYWSRILSFDNTHIVKQAYLTLLDTYKSGQNNWCTIICNILNEANLHSCWQDQIFDEKNLLTLKERLSKHFMDKCINEIHDSDKYPKLRTYKTFKSEFKSENYLTWPCSKGHTVALTKFRLSSHNLAIETGRYTRPKTPSSERKCTLCEEDQVEDEKHFLLQCPYYREERMTLLDSIRQINPSVDTLNETLKFTNIMTNNTKENITALGKFISKCMKKRYNKIAGQRDNDNNN